MCTSMGSDQCQFDSEIDSGSLSHVRQTITDDEVSPFMRFVAHWQLSSSMTIAAPLSPDVVPVFGCAAMFVSDFVATVRNTSP
jgi:hypothetical protein